MQRNEEGDGMLKRIISALFLIASLAGCAQTETMQVSSLVADDSVDYRKFAIVSDEYKTVDNDLAFADFARQTKQMLELKGFTPVANIKDAQILVALSYHIDEPQTHTEVVSTSRPIMPVYPGRRGYYYHPFWDYPMYDTSVYQFTTYKKMIRLQAINAKNYSRTKNVKPVWDVVVTSNNGSSDLRYMMPYMLVAASSYVDKSSSYTVNVSLDQKDPRVGQIRSWPITDF